jgi:hypothetical protein
VIVRQFRRAQLRLKEHPFEGEGDDLRIFSHAIAAQGDLAAGGDSCRLG